MLVRICFPDGALHVTPTEGRRYQVHKVLGRGGFGTVYEAEMVSTGGFSKAVALKVLNREMDAVEGVAQRLRDEARLLGRLKHPAIVRVDDLVRLDGRWTVVMELLTGANLHQVLREVGPLPLGVAMEIAQVVAGALHGAHDRPGPEGRPMGVLHRDIKPSNIQITPLGEVKVLDFGVARASFGGREAQTHSLIFGSVGYMAPERLAGRDSHAGDVYALGVVTYEILAGRRLGTACSHPRLQASMIEEAVEELSRLHPDPDLRTLLTCALAFNPDDRPRARAFQRLARAVRTRHLDPWISDWAEEVMVRVMPALKTDAGRLTGHVLVEADQPRPGVWDNEKDVVGDEAQDLAQDLAQDRVPAPPTSAPAGPDPSPPTPRAPSETEDQVPPEPFGLPSQAVQPAVGASATPAAAEAAPEDKTLRVSPVLAERLLSGSPGDPTHFERVTHLSEVTPSGSTTLVEVPGTQALPADLRGSAEGERTSVFQATVRWPFAVGVGLGASAMVILVGAGLLSGAWSLPASETPAPPTAVTVADPVPAVAAPQAGVELPEEPVVEPVIPPAPAPSRRSPAVEAVPRAPSAGTPAPARAAPQEQPSPWGPMPAVTVPAPTAPGQTPPAAAIPAAAGVAVLGDALAVTLRGLAGDFAPGSVPAGHYAVMVTFAPGEPEKKALEIDLSPGQHLNLRCEADFGRCVVAETVP
jgi:serine/threonine protein kinase